MGVISLLESGFLYSDNFTDEGLSPEWDILPYDLSRVDKRSDRLVLRHGDEPIHVILSMLTNEMECILDIKNAYVPINESDVGGIVIRGTSTENITLEEYYNIETNSVHSYPWIRVVRSFNNYSAYWSDDGSKWNLLGSSYFVNSTPKIGIYLGGDVGSEYELLEVRAFKKSNITVGNLCPGMVVSILNEDGEVLRSSKCLKLRDAVEINVADLAMPIKGMFKFTMADGTSYNDSTLYDIYGGDKYSFSITPVVYYESTDQVREEVLFKPLAPNIEEFMGYFGGSYGNTATVRMKANNPYLGVFKSTTLNVAEYKTDYHETHVYLALDDNGVAGEPRKSITLGDVATDSDVYFWVLMDRGDITTQLANQLTFGIDIVTKFE